MRLDAFQEYHKPQCRTASPDWARDDEVNALVPRQLKVNGCLSQVVGIYASQQPAWMQYDKEMKEASYQQVVYSLLCHMVNSSSAPGNRIWESGERSMSYMSAELNEPLCIHTTPRGLHWYSKDTQFLHWMPGQTGYCILLVDSSIHT